MEKEINWKIYEEVPEIKECSCNGCDLASDYERCITVRGECRRKRIIYKLKFPDQHQLKQSINILKSHKEYHEGADPIDKFTPDQIIEALDFAITELEKQLKQ